MEIAARPPLKKHVGNWNSPSYKSDSKELITFYSMAKAQTIFVSANEFIVFKNRTYRTNSKQQIQFLRSNGQFNKTIVEGEIPDDWKKMFEKNEKYFTKDPDEYES